MAFLTRLYRAKGQRARPICGLTISLMAIGTICLLAEPPTPEYQVKAVFLFNLAQFVDWPSKAFADPAAPLIIGVLGEDPFGSYLDETLRGETVRNHPLVLQRYRRLS